jgi:hypothetical protein
MPDRAKTKDDKRQGPTTAKSCKDKRQVANTLRKEKVMTTSYEQQLVKWAATRYGLDPEKISKVDLSVCTDTNGCDTCGYESQWVDVAVWNEGRSLLAAEGFNFDGANNSFSSLLQEIIEA